MSEEAVRLIVTQSRDEYEEKIGGPRHSANLSNFKELFAVLDKVKGALWALLFLVGIPGSIASVLVIVRSIRHM